MDQKSQHTLEFNKILSQLADYTHFSGGRDLVLQLTPTTDEIEATQWQTETAEALSLLHSGTDVTIGAARDVRSMVERTSRGMILQAEELLAIRNTIVAGRTLKRKIDKVRARYPHLQAIAEIIEECPGLVQTINQTIDDRGEVLDTASTKLSKTRQQLNITHGRIQEKLRSIINNKSVYLQEALISQRNGRYVVPVRAESRTNIKGIVHDQSGSGATVWIEPLATVELNNSFRGLQIEEEKEIQRILSELSSRVAEVGDAIVRVVDRMAEFDLIFAKARYASAINGIQPTFVPWRPYNPENAHPGSTVWFKQARHPLIDPQEIVPVNITIPEEVFLVLITGPNTGGKTVSLKTAGLMVLMAQSGLHVPCTEARLSLFDHVFADIGDEQSIEQSLSTFSAHLTNIIRVISGTDDRSLVLLDELGSGTDPAEGAALAQAIIDYLRDKGSTLLSATHYPELKAYATHTAGATNASLLFDVETLSPTYVMTIGLPGKSNALAIARRLGLDNTVIDSALKKLGVESRETEQLLDSIYDLRDKIATEEAAARLARKRVERNEAKLQQKIDQIEEERVKILQEARDEFQKELDVIRQDINRVRRQLRSSESRNQLKRLTRSVDDIEARPLAAITPTPMLDAILPKEDRTEKRRKLRVGDEVHIKTIRTKGVVIVLHKNDAEIAIGRLHMRVNLAELEFRGRPIVEKEETIVLPKGPSPGLELDIRGERVDSGLSKLDQYLDAALRARMPWVRIIHGKGTGRLRTAVRQELTKHTAVLSWEEGKNGEGGPGVTVARFEEVAEEVA